MVLTTPHANSGQGHPFDDLEWEASITLLLSYEGTSPATPVPYEGPQGGNVLRHVGLRAPPPPAPPAAPFAQSQIASNPADVYDANRR